MRAQACVCMRANVERVDRFGGGGNMVTLALPRGFIAPRAGQFVQVACNDVPAFRLRRPFSICGWQGRSGGGALSILFSVVGEGSRWLAFRGIGDEVDVLGPLGNPFRPMPGRIPVLIGGGRGVAPLLFLAQQIAEAFPDGMLLYGARDQASLFPTNESPYPVYRATLDGSVGQHGTVLDLLHELVGRGSVRANAAALYACGPTAMLEAVGSFAREAGFPAEVSVETTFGCGTGLCAGCAVPLLPREDRVSDAFSRYAFACTDGPVFDAAVVDWQEFCG